MSLEDVSAAADESEAADRRLKEAVQAALDEGANVAEVARAARRTRQTIYRWAHGDTHRTVSVIDSLDDALSVVHQLGQFRLASEGLGTDKPFAKANRLKLAARNVDAHAWREAGLDQVGSEEASQLSVGLQVAALITAKPELAKHHRIRISS